MKKVLVAAACCAVAMAAGSALPASADAAIHTYVNNQAMADNTSQNSTNGPQNRWDNRVNRPVGKLFRSRILYTNSVTVDASSSTLQPVIAYGNPYYAYQSYGVCSNISGTYSINVTCWTNDL
jgi:hypothetical protein